MLFGKDRVRSSNNLGRQMQRKLLPLKIVFGILTNWLLALPIAAQVTPDGSLPTRVERQGNDYTIEDGAREGNNLFHSFSDFSVPDGGSAAFNNSPDVINILSRVTGGNISNIEGLIRAKGEANLFLINPAGIIFGENARLDLGGSFYGSTADSILFPNGIEFSARDLQSPILTINAPIGLNLRADSGEIINRSVASDGSDFAFPSGLAVNEEQSIAFEANKITFEGGLLTAPGGSITLNALEDIRIIGNTFDDSLSTESEISNGGAININSANGAIEFTNAEISSDSFAESGNAGDLNIFAPESLTFKDSTLNAVADLEGAGGNVTIKSGTAIEFIDTRIDTGAFGNGRSGDINIEASNQGAINFIGTQAESTQIFTDAFGSGEDLLNNQTGGNLNINGGDITINNYEFISQVNILDKTDDFIGIFNPNDRGNGGDITITGKQISIINNSLLETQTLGEGTAGNININGDTLTLNNSKIEASNRTPENIKEDSFGGDINIQLNDLLVLRDNSSIIAEGIKNASAGNIDINSQFVIALPSSGNGNDIITTAEAGAGGKIDITTESIFNLENRTSIDNNATNDLDARSDLGVDGNVFVNTILVNEIDRAVDLSFDLVNVDRQTAYVCQTKGNNSELVIKKTGSLGSDPAAPFISEDIYIKNQPVNLLESTNSQVDNSSEIDYIQTSNGKIVVAKGAVVGENGQVRLVAYSTSSNDRENVSDWQNCQSYLP